METPLNFSDFKLKQATLEIRYDNAYALWDKAGAIWTHLNSKWNTLEMVKADPMVTTFTLNKKFDLSVKLNLAYIIDINPTSSLKDFSECAVHFFDSIFKMLDVNKFQRIGFRIIFSKKVNDKEEASRLVTNSKLFNIPEGRYFNTENKILSPSLSFVMEGENIGTRISIMANTNKLIFEAPRHFEEMTSREIEKHEVIYDVDYYTITPIAKGQLNISEWLSQAHHLIKRDSAKLLGE